MPLNVDLLPENLNLQAFTDQQIDSLPEAGQGRLRDFGSI